MPGWSPSVQAVRARPSAFVAAVSGSAAPSPAAGAKTTITSSTGVPPASVTSTTTASASARPWRAACPSPDVTSIADGACATTTLAVALSPSNEAVSVPDPFATAFTTPASVTVNTEGRLVRHPTTPANASPY